jgi:hypothetical protein
MLVTRKLCICDAEDLFQDQASQAVTNEQHGTNFYLIIKSDLDDIHAKFPIYKRVEIAIIHLKHEYVANQTTS